VVLPEEDAAEFAALEAAMIEELAPDGVLQSVLVQRIVAAAWRLGRAERIETELFAENGLPDGTLGLALIRDGNRAGAFGTLLRDRGGALAEFWRALRTLKALQAEVAAPQAEVARPARRPRAVPPTPQRDEPKSRGNRGDLVTPVRVELDIGALELTSLPPRPWPAEPLSPFQEPRAGEPGPKAARCWPGPPWLRLASLATGGRRRPAARRSGSR
jgi:hypothetical protein